ncbi:YEATS domain-containing protein 2 [Episyrphus balteatus]|uniref:YEATS domain-containing protein 2 n=1 Tax=Episyrphus balteatus TaxID=286459 RepID=UPI002485F579|nr:YEATS domain-containing protein 2 [Episyrphus balteatus]
MSQKRKFEEYHDPDYPQDNSGKRLRTTSLQSSEQRNARIKEIINREFNREVHFREEQLDEIDTKLAKAKDILHQIRYTVVSDYYQKQNLLYSESEAAVMRGSSLFDNEPDGPQVPLHPAIKKIVGKKPKSYDELLRVRPTVREAAKTAKTSIKEKSRTKKEEKRIQRMIKQRGIVIDHSNPEQNADVAAMMGIQDPNGPPIKIPRHVEPIKVDKPLPKLNSARLNNQTKHLIVVGNTSKYIGDEKPSDNSSHKWLVYVQSKSSIPIEKFVTKVRFFLHPSYRPNDVVDVEIPPFQLARRGWGEFPVRLQLFFDPQIDQKPVQLVHNLILDKTLSGLQTMGAETLVEIWLRTDSIIPPSLSPPSTSTKPSYRTATLTKSKHLLSPSKTAEIINPKPEIDDNLFDFLDKIESPTICADIEKIQPTFMDSPIVDSQICRRPLGLPPARNITESIMRLSEEPSTSSVSSSLPSSSPRSSTITSSSSILLSPKAEKKFTPKSPPPIVSENDKIHQPVKMKQEPLPPPSLPPPAPPTPMVAIPSKQFPVEKKATSTVTHTNGTSSLIVNPNVLQKKLVQFIDKDGNVKIMQVLIAPKKPGAAPQTTIQKPTIVNGLPKVVTNNGEALQQLHNVKKPPPKLNDIDANGNIQGKFQVKEISSSPSSSPAHSSPKHQPTSTVTHLDNNSGSNQFGSKPIFRRNGPQVKNQVIHKEGKVFIIDPMQTKIKQEQKKQVSLLKPQISLLKPIVQNDNLGNCIRNNAVKVFKHTSIATDHDYTNRLNPNRSAPNTVTITKTLPPSQSSPAAFRRANTITVRNVINPANFVPSRVPELKKGNFIPVKVNHKPVIALMKKQRREYRRELEQQFNNTAFATVRSGVEFLLRRLPMVNSLALENDYKMAFPFVIATWAEFRKTISIKLKALEWLRAKYISRSITQHPKLKTANLWTTKEIVIFARHHAYTPVINSTQEAKDAQIGNNKIKTETKDPSLTELVKNEIEKEHIHYQTVTPNHRICDWTERAWKRVNTHYKEHETIIDVDGLDDNESETKRLIKQSPLKTYQGKLWLSIDEKLEKEANLVSGMCQDIGIRLQPEEIHRDVIHPTAQTLMSKTLRLFIQDIVRRSIAFKMKNNKEISPNDICLEPDNIRSALNSRTEFDFITNKYFGTIKSKDLLELG